MYNEDFIKRLNDLRIEKGISARDMSLSIGQNPGYINNIESGKALPSMNTFFYICDYLNITPRDFFDLQNTNPKKLSSIVENMKYLNSEQLESLDTIIKGLRSNY